MPQDLRNFGLINTKVYWADVPKVLFYLCCIFNSPFSVFLHEVLDIYSLVSFLCHICPQCMGWSLVFNSMWLLLSWSIKEILLWNPSPYWLPAFHDSFPFSFESWFSTQLLCGHWSRLPDILFHSILLRIQLLVPWIQVGRAGKEGIQPGQIRSLCQVAAR